jgi:DNA invertase Pin-like site-specific DNA recombinase
MSKGQRIGYIRVSSYDQNDDRQRELIGAADRIFTDKASGKDTDRPQLQAMITYAREGDMVVVHSMDRLARNLDDLRQMVSSLTKRGIHVQFIREGLVFTGNDNPMDNLMLSVLGAVAQFERDKIKERQMEGIVLAKRRGVYKGRKRSLSPDKIEELRQRSSAGEKKLHLAREYNISRETLYQYLRHS